MSLIELEPIAVAAIRWHEAHKDAPKPYLPNCRRVGHAIELRDVHGVLLAELYDSLEISHSDLPKSPAPALVEDTVLVLRCHGCNRRTLRRLYEYEVRAQFRCPNCDAINVLVALDAIHRGLKTAG